jgi:hypothetical protein
VVAIDRSFFSTELLFFFYINRVQRLEVSVQRRLRWVKKMLIIGYWPGTVALDIIFVIILSLHISISY